MLASERSLRIFTHHKCASSWLDAVLRQYCLSHDIPYFCTHVIDQPPPAGDDRVCLFVNSEFESCKKLLVRPPRGASAPTAVHIIRNPLDLVVSAYYSHLHSHPLEGWPELARQRALLQGLDKQAGLAATWVFLERCDFHRGTPGPLHALRRWDFDDASMVTLRMEDVVRNHEILQSATASFFEPDLAAIVGQFSFEKLSGGRAVGATDVSHHYRSGVGNEWITEMDASLADAIYATYRGLIDRFYPAVHDELGVDAGTHPGEGP